MTIRLFVDLTISLFGRTAFFSMCKMQQNEQLTSEVFTGFSNELSGELSGEVYSGEVYVCKMSKKCCGNMGWSFHFLLRIANFFKHLCQEKCIASLRCFTILVLHPCHFGKLRKWSQEGKLRKWSQEGKLSKSSQGKQVKSSQLKFKKWSLVSQVK